MKCLILIILSCLSSAILAQVPVGYVSYWKMDGNLTDESGLNNGTIQGGEATYVEGVNNKAVKLNNSALYVDAGTNASLDFSGSFSIGGWVYLTGNAGYQKMVDKSTWNSGFYIQEGGSWPGYWEFKFQGREGVMETQDINTQMNSWVHLMGVYDGAIMYLYRNGTLVDTITSDSGMIATTASLKFGKVSGLLDEMIYYNRALSAGEVTELMAATRDTTPPVISSITADTLPVSSAMITWKTNMIATAEVEYGIDTFYFSRLHPELDTLHAVRINGLVDGTQYRYRVRSKNSQGYESVSPWCTLAVSALNPRQKMNLPATVSPRIIVPPDRVWPANIGDADVCLWADDKLSALNLSVDDNALYEQTWWITMAKRYGFQVTWFVVPGGFDIANASASYFGTWDTWKTAVDSGQEVTSHSYLHGCAACSGSYYYGTDYEYSEPISSIAHTYGYRPLTIAYPGQNVFTNDPEIARKYYIAARATYGGLNPTATMDYMALHVTTLDTATVQSAVAARALHLNYYHQVSGNTLTDAQRESLWTLKEAEFAWIKNRYGNDIWWDGFTRIMQYAQSRDTRTLTVNMVTDSLITFTLTDSMMDILFDYPLTVKVRLDNSWPACNARQNNAVIPCSLAIHNSNLYALVKAVPDRGEVRLIKGGTTGLKLIKTLQLNDQKNAIKATLYDVRGYCLGSARINSQGFVSTDVIDRFQTGIYLFKIDGTASFEKRLIIQ